MNKAPTEPWHRREFLAADGGGDGGARGPAARTRSRRAAPRDDEAAAGAHHRSRLGTPQLVAEDLLRTEGSTWAASSCSPRSEFAPCGPQKILAQGTDWRFLNELKKELKG